MQPTIEVDFREWQKAAKELFATSKRTLPDFVNGQALAVASRAIKLTKKADRRKIEKQLGQLARTTKTSRTGKTRTTGRIIRKDSLAERILLKRFNESGTWSAQGSTLEERAANFIARRVRSISYIRSGWIPAVKLLSTLVKQKPRGSSVSSSQVSAFGRPNGKAVPAKANLGLIEATIENSVPALAPTTNKDAVSGLSEALKVSARDMIETLAKRLKRDMAKNGMR